MKNNIMSKRVLASGLLLLFLLTASLIVLLIPSRQVYAETSDMLIVEDMSDDYAITKRYTNIQGFLNLKKSRSRSISKEGQVNALCDTLYIDREELFGMDESVLLTAQSITISDTLMVTDEDGNLNTLAINYESARDFSDITGDNGNGGYMAGRIIVIQDSSHNKYNSQNKFVAYGFECSFTMRWLKKPTYTMKDYFTFCSDNAYTEEDSECTLTADVRSESSSMGVERFTRSIGAGKSYSSGWPVFHFNLFDDVYSSTNSLTYSNQRISARARLYSTSNFRIRMAYAHKQLVAGDLSVSISTSGPSISFSGLKSSRRVYETPNFDVGFVPN